MSGAIRNGKGRIDVGGAAKEKKPEDFKPMHITIVPEDTKGNGERGRYWILPGSMGRAKAIADKYFRDVTVRESARGHNAFLGRIPATRPGEFIDVGTISTGMGAPSVDIIVTEMILLGARVFMRVGTAGGIHPELEVGDLVVASAAVRDEGTTRHYMPLEFPAIAHHSVVDALVKSCDKICQKEAGVRYALGVVHSKDSLMAREFKFGQMAQAHHDYMEALEGLGCLASEMECSMLFSLGQIHHLRGVKTGAVLAVIGGKHVPFSDDKEAHARAVNRSIEAVIDAISTFHNENQQVSTTAGLAKLPRAQSTPCLASIDATLTEL